MMLHWSPCFARPRRSAAAARPLARPNSLPLLVLLVALSPSACSSSEHSGGNLQPTTPDAAVAADQTVIGMEGVEVSFGNENRRTVDVPVTFPSADQNFDRVILNFALRCPNGRCDWWDRIGWLSIVEDAGTDNEVTYELSRFITPYRVGAAWSIDVTDLLPLLRGPTTLRVFIDTWVGPGHANGDGWLVDAAFEFRGGIASPRPVAVIPIFATQSFVYGDPARPAGLEASVAVPANAAATRIRTFITGHGQGSADNCAEFCSREHTVAVNGTDFAREIWRDDCIQTAAPNQQGTWTYARAGWCPGAVVFDWTQNVSESVRAGTTASIAYRVQDWENTCRPDAVECSGCLAGDCNYNSNGHTEPIYYVSSYLIVYEP